MKVTAQILRDRDACEEQVDVFIRLFGDGTEVVITKGRCAKFADTFDWDWAAEYLLSHAAWEEYDQETSKLYQEIMEKIAPFTFRHDLWEKYETACALIFGELAEKE